ncbi:MAG: hypothetical protein KGJ40_06010 [candidate division NC10 bacterium]|nr:hypothetical protein [candidate division NC10 bacterium]
MEILIAAAIVATGLLAMVAMFPTGYSTVTKSGIQSTGLALAQQQIEVWRNTSYAVITNPTLPIPSTCSPSPPSPPPTGYTPAGYTCNTTNVSVDIPVQNATTITVTVTLPIDCPPNLRPCLPYGVTTSNCPDLTKRCIRLTSIIAQ